MDQVHSSRCQRRQPEPIITMTQMLVQEPGWKLERKGSALLLRRDSLQSSKTQRVCFRCDVEVREYERDEDYYGYPEPDYYQHQQVSEVAASPLAMCASCLAALCVTVVLPWLLMGG
ncbi:uncharacterized protein LOC100679073 isoform X3 [Nasonia vitripennis]|uniref:Uncharacterized protein n=2 Tax=Nasonia vitripennis TaxID=7425 RepID=A0A7M7T7L1_NASVI|nr:uncharacterized protein LOC100679073 isoform X3 [Nasonia vitripennis]